MSEFTRILQAVQQGDPQAADELLPLVYGELRKLATAKMAKETPNQTLQPAALVHEAWLRLVEMRIRNGTGITSGTGVRRYFASANFGTYVSVPVKGNSLKQPWYLTFRTTNPSTLAYQP